MSMQQRRRHKVRQNEEDDYISHEEDGEEEEVSDGHEHDEEEDDEEEEHEDREEEEEEEEEEMDEDEKKMRREELLSDSHRRQLRHNILQLISDTHQTSKQLVQPGNDMIKRYITRGNNYFSKVVHAREGALDAEWATQISAIGLEQVSRIRVGQEWNPAEFLRRIRSNYATQRRASAEEEEDVDSDEEAVDPGINDDDSGSDKIDWMRLGRDAAKFFQRTPTVTFMNGPIFTEIKKRKVARRRKQDAPKARVERPEEVSGKEQESGNETMKNAGRLYHRMKRMQAAKEDEPISYYDVVLDPTSFTKTIENMFYYSFMIKQGLVGVSYDKSGNDLHAQLHNAPTDGDVLPRKQCIMKLNLDIWAKLVRERGGDPSGQMQEAAEKTGAGPSVPSASITRRKTKMMLPPGDSGSHTIETRPKRGRSIVQVESSDEDNEDELNGSSGSRQAAKRARVRR